MRSASDIRIPYRLLIALLVGVLAGLHVYGTVRGGATRTSDFAQLWAGARALLDGGDPYQAVGPGRALEWHTSLVYPLPAVLLAMPVAGLSLRAADAVFAGVGASLLAFALATRGGFALLGLTSWCFLQALLIVQWSPYLAAGIVLPVLGWIVVAKPHVGLAVAAARVTRPMLLGGIALTALAFLVLPDWPVRWWAALQAPTQQVTTGGPVYAMYGAWVTLPFGPLALLAVLRWRRPEARVLLVLACVPQTTLPFELLPLLAVVPRRWWESALLSAGSWCAWAADVHLQLNTRPIPEFFALNGRLGLWGVLLPALAMVLARPNEGDLHPRLDALLERWRLPIRVRKVPTVRTSSRQPEAEVSS